MVYKIHKRQMKSYTQMYPKIETGTEAGVYDGRGKVQLSGHYTTAFQTEVTVI